MDSRDGTTLSLDLFGSTVSFAGPITALGLGKGRFSSYHILHIIGACKGSAKGRAKGTCKELCKEAAREAVHEQQAYNAGRA